MASLHTKPQEGTLIFDRCARGFTLRTDSRTYSGLPVVWAFNHIEDVASWLVRTYATDHVEEGPCKPEAIVTRPSCVPTHPVLRRNSDSRT